MAAFIQAMDAYTTANAKHTDGSLRLGENSAPEYTAQGVGDPRVALFTALVRNLDDARLMELWGSVMRMVREKGDVSVLVDLVVLMFQTRNTRGGKGERALFLKMYLLLNTEYPETARALSPLMAHYGYYKDYLLLLEMMRASSNGDDKAEEGRRKLPPNAQALEDCILDAIAAQLRKDHDALSASAVLPESGLAPSAPATTTPAGTTAGGWGDHGDGDAEITTDKPGAGGAATATAGAGGKKVRSKGKNKAPAPSLSLLAKYAPKPHKHFTKGVNRATYKSLLQRMFPGSATAEAKYRKMLSALNRALDTTEVYMAAKRYEGINFARVPSLCLNRHRKAFLNEKLKEAPGVTQMETGNRFPDDHDRVACRQHLKDAMRKKGVIKADRLMPHEVVKVFLEELATYNFRQRVVSEDEAELLSAQWDQLRDSVQKTLADTRAKRAEETEGDAADAMAVEAEGGVDLGKVVPLVDVSGSMAGTPMEVAIALGILSSELTSPAFRHRFITFSGEPEWIDLSNCSSLRDKVKTTLEAPWGANTNFAAALEMILDAATAANLIPRDIPTLLVFSDMQFDQAAERIVMPGMDHRVTIDQQETWEAHLPRLRRLFAERGKEVCGEPWEVPRIVFWNLRGDTHGFPAQADTPGVQMLSGFSPSMLKLLLAGNAPVSPTSTTTTITPYDTFRAAVDDDLYDPVREVLSRSSEGVLGGYTYVKVEKGEGGGEEEEEWEKLEGMDVTTP